MVWGSDNVDTIAKRRKEDTKYPVVKTPVANYPTPIVGKY